MPRKKDSGPIVVLVGGISVNILNKCTIDVPISQSTFESENDMIIFEQKIYKIILYLINEGFLNSGSIKVNYISL